MAKKLDCVLLIDDDYATNFLHERILKKSGCVEKVVTVLNGREALEFLRTEEDGQLPQPDIIFLDINMPVMDGWDFLEEYHKLSEAEKAKVVLVMLTTSLNPDDKRRAASFEEVSGFKNKPLTFEMMDEILAEYFETAEQ